MTGKFHFILFSFLVAYSTVYAEQKKTVSPGLFKKLQKADKLVSAKDYAGALKVAEAGLQAANSDYEKATFLRSLASINSLRGHYEHAAHLLAECIALNALNTEQQQQALYDLGQLYMATEQYSQAVTVLEPWLQTHNNVKADTYVLLAHAHTQLKHYRKALPYITQAIGMKKKPPESWYQLNLALYYEIKDYQSAATILKKLIRLQPQHKPYWNQLVSVYQQLDNFNKATSVKHLAYTQGLLHNESELLDLVNLFLYVDMPYQGAMLLDSEIQKQRVKSSPKNLTLLADAWTQAREYEQAIKTLKQASKISDDGMLYQRLGHVFVEQERWHEAVDALTKAVQKGKIKQTGNTYLLLGISYFELDKKEYSKRAFSKALNYSTSKKSATQWLEYIDKLNPEQNQVKSLDG